MYSRICLLSILMGLFLLGSNKAFSQSQKGFDMGKLYDLAIKKYLLPSVDHSESILYLEKPSFEPEYSIQIVIYNDSIKLEGNFFKENYFGQLVLHIQKYYNADFEPELKHYSILVSKRFKKKMEFAFSQTIKSKPQQTSSPEEGLRIFDGTTYLFRLKNAINSSNEVEDPKPNTTAFKTAAICSTIAISMKNNSFNELNIIEKINELGY